MIMCTKNEKSIKLFKIFGFELFDKAVDLQ